MNFLRKILKKKRQQDCYIVRGQKFLSEEEVVSLLAKVKAPHLRGYEESGLGRPLTADDSLENSWIRIYRVSNNESEALFYAREQVRDGMDGSFATIEAFAPDEKVFYTVKKENGKVTVFNHQEKELEDAKVLVANVTHLKMFDSKMQVFHDSLEQHNIVIKDDDEEYKALSDAMSETKEENTIKSSRYEIAATAVCIVLGSYFLGGFLMWILCISFITKVDLSVWYWLAPALVMALSTFIGVQVWLQGNKKDIC